MNGLGYFFMVPFYRMIERLSKDIFRCVQPKIFCKLLYFLLFSRITSKFNFSAFCILFFHNFNKMSCEFYILQTGFGKRFLWEQRHILQLQSNPHKYPAPRKEKN